MKELTDKQIKIAAGGAIVLALVCIVVVILMTAKARRLQQKQEAEDQAFTNAVAAAKGAPVPPAPTPPQPGITDRVMGYLGGLFQDTKPAPQVMNTDPTYVFASRLNDSIEDAWASSNKTELWNDLATRQDEFVKHVVNWYNGQFGGGKTLRQNLEGEWTGDKSKLLQKLSKIGL